MNFCVQYYNSRLLVFSVHVVFGHVIGGATLVRQLEALPVDRNARPLQDVSVTNCGQLVRLNGKFGVETQLI